MINELLSKRDPRTGAPYVNLKAGRPDWDREFVSVRDQHRREKIGVIFCGAPAIAAAFKRACETHSNAQEGTLFELRKENF